MLDELIDAGVDIISPVQPRPAGMESHALKARFGDRVVFHGGIDTQLTLPSGTPQDVADEVRHRIQALGSGGGYIVAPAHNFQDDVPPENIVALYDAAYVYGQYPLS